MESLDRNLPLHSVESLPLTITTFVSCSRAATSVGGSEKEESHVQAQVLDEQGDWERHAHTYNTYLSRCMECLAVCCHCGICVSVDAFTVSCGQTPHTLTAVHMVWSTLAEWIQTMFKETLLRTKTLEGKAKHTRVKSQGWWHRSCCTHRNVV